MSRGESNRLLGLPPGPRHCILQMLARLPSAHDPAPPRPLHHAPRGSLNGLRRVCKTLCEDVHDTATELCLGAPERGGAAVMVDVVPRLPRSLASLTLGCFGPQNYEVRPEDLAGRLLEGVAGGMRLRKLITVNGWGDAEYAALGPALRQMAPHLEELHIYMPTSLTLAQGGGPDSLPSVLAQLSGLRCLALCDNQITPGNGLDRLADATQHLTNLTKLQLGDNPRRGFVAEIGAMEAPRLSRMVAPLSQLRELSLSRTLGAKGAAVLSRGGLAGLSLLTSLGLRGSYLGVTGATIVMEQLAASCPQLLALDLSRNQVGGMLEGSPDRLGAALGALTGLTRLDLSQNWNLFGRFDPPTISYPVLDALRRLGRLVELDVRGVNLRDGLLELFLGNLRPSLRRLQTENTGVSQDRVLRMVGALDRLYYMNVKGDAESVSEYDDDDDEYDDDEEEQWPDSSEAEDDPGSD